MKISAKKKGVNNISSDQTLRGFIVPRYFRCSGERRDAVWLWCFRNVVWTTELHLPFLWYPNCYFKWFSSLVFVTTYVSILPRVGIEKHVCRHLRVYISPLLFVSAKQCRLPAWPTKRHPCSTCCLIHLFNYLCLFPGIIIKKRSFLMFSCVFSYLDLSMDPQGFWGIAPHCHVPSAFLSMKNKTGTRIPSFGTFIIILDADPNPAADLFFHDIW